MVERYLVEVAAPRPLVLLKPVPTVAVGEFVQLVAVVEHQSSAVVEGVAPAPTADAGGTRAQCAKCFVGLAGRAEAIWIHGPWPGHVRSRAGSQDRKSVV